jgi:hypothetical protein
MPDISMCADDDCPSRLKCYRYVALPSDIRQDYADFERQPNQQRCNYYIKANCCETSKREWGNGALEGEEQDCLFCNRTHQWTGTTWKGVYP